MPYAVKIISIEPVTHDVHHFVVEKPPGYEFTPGQATDVAIGKPEWREEKRPFTFTSLVNDDALEFTIKHYPDHEGVTDKMRELIIGDELIIDEPWGTIEYKGPGTFIAGGAGVTPFISILRDLDRKGDVAGNRLILGNKTEADIILMQEFEYMAGLETLHVLSDEQKSGFKHGLIDKSLLEKEVSDFSSQFYVCGPKPMQDSVNDALAELGAETQNITFEK